MKQRPEAGPSRKQLLGIAAASAIAALVVLIASVWERLPAGGPVITVYKHPQCGCCTKWIAHLEEAGFSVEAHHELRQSERQTALGVPERLRSCHTATVDGFVIEGHVPAEDIRRLLRERPAARGLSVPGMPIGSPGMEQGARVDAYEVLLFDGAGSSTTFAKHGEGDQ